MGRFVLLPARPLRLNDEQHVDGRAVGLPYVVVILTTAFGVLGHDRYSGVLFRHHCVNAAADV